MKKIHKFNYFYKITNNLTNQYYYGIHSTDNLDDGYMGSGRRLQRMYKKYGIENFTKEILEFFDDRESLEEYESEMVTEDLVRDRNCYNSIVGGGKNPRIGHVTVLAGDKYILITCEEYHKNKDKYKTFSKGEVTVRLKGEKENYYISADEFNTNKDKYEGVTKGLVCVKDKSGKFYMVSLNDPRYINGELVHLWKGKKHRAETIDKLKKTFKQIRHQQGEKNSRYDTVWVTRDGINKSINKEFLEEYIKNGWSKGRKLNMPNDKCNNIDINVVLNLRSEGKRWVDIAAYYGISENILYKWKRRNNI